MVKNLPAMWEMQVWSLGKKESLEKGMATQFSVLAGELQGQRSLAGYSPWAHKELEFLQPREFHFHSSRASISPFCPWFLHIFLLLCRSWLKCHLFREVSPDHSTWRDHSFFITSLFLHFSLCFAILLYSYIYAIWLYSHTYIFISHHRM